MQKQKIENLEQTERLIDAIDKLSFIIDNSKRFQPQDYSQLLMNIFSALNEISNTNKCLDKIHQELRNLNKTIIMSALLLSTITEPEKTLQSYKKIIDMYIK